MPKIFTRTDTKTAKKTLSIYIDEIKKDKRLFWKYALLIPINRLFYVVLLPLTFSLIIQSLVLHPTDWQHPIMLLAGAVLISLIALLTSYFGFERLFVHEEIIRTSLMKRAIRTLMSHSDQFFANRKIGTLAGDVNTFAGSIITFLDVIFMQASGIIVNFAASLIIIAFMSPILLLPLSLITGLLIWRSITGTVKRGPLRHKRKTLMSQLNGTVADILANQQIVRYFASSKREIDRVLQDRQHIDLVAREEIKILQREAIIRQAILFAFQVITMGVCIWLFTTGNVSIAALIFAVTYLGRLTSTMFDLSNIIRTTEQGFLDASNITEILNVSPEVIDKPNAPRLRVTKGALSLNSVSFAYKDSAATQVIEDITLHIKPGERVGLAGYSGGGKTTLTKLILRFADVSQGSISIDGQDITNVSQDSLRAHIAYVPQEPYLFHRSLRDNIAYGKPDASDKEIMMAVKRANASDFIDDLPAGLDTIVGERGVKLSGGQRQRIAIARAILKNAPILVLDEATSALDSESEKLIQSALEKLMKKRTSVVIAHRLSTIAHLDRIIVLDKGRIVEDGSHATLLEKKGIYASLWSHQSGGFIEE